MLNKIKFKMGEWFPKSQKSKSLLKSALCFAAAIIVTGSIFIEDNKKTSVVEVIKPVKMITEGSKIRQQDLMTVEVSQYGLPRGALKETAEIVGKYAKSDIYPIDYITLSKLTDKKSQPFRTLKKNERIMSFTVPTLAASVASNINVGDKIQVMYAETLTDQSGVENTSLITTPDCLNNLEVIDIKDANGYTKAESQKESTKNYAETAFVPSVITVVVTDEQAAELYKAELTKSIYAVFLER